MQDRKPAPLARGMVQLFGQGQAIERVHRVKQEHRFSRLVALQMPDEVPSGGQAFEMRRLRFPLLHAILAEVAERRASKASRIRSEETPLEMPTSVMS